MQRKDRGNLLSFVTARFLAVMVTNALLSKLAIVLGNTPQYSKFSVTLYANVYIRYLVQFSLEGLTLQQLAALLKVTFFHGCFSRYLSCANGTISRNASHTKQ